MILKRLKKTSYLLISLVLSIFFALSFTGCSNDEESRGLTKDNYTSYLSLNITIEQMDVVFVEKEYPAISYYDASYIVKIVARPTGNYRFEVANVGICLTITEWNKQENLKMNIDYYGYGEATVCLQTQRQQKTDLLTSADDFSIKVNSAYGAVIS